MTPTLTASKAYTPRLSLAITKLDSAFHGRWLILLENELKDSYTAFYTRERRSRENTYRYRVRDGRMSDLDAKNTLMARVTLGRLHAEGSEDLDAFMASFWDTAPAPSAFFAVRFLYSLYEEGIVSAEVLGEALAVEAEYAHRELHCFYENVCRADLELYRDVLWDSGVGLPEGGDQREQLDYVRMNEHLDAVDREAGAFADREWDGDRNEDPLNWDEWLVDH